MIHTPFFPKTSSANSSTPSMGCLPAFLIVPSDFSIMLGSRSVEEVGREIFEAVIRVAGGEPTKAELLEHREFAIPRIGSTL